MGLSKQTISSYFFFGLTICLFMACNRPSKTPNWMVGKWRTSYDGFEIEETWFPTSKGLVGKTIWKDGKDVQQENLQLYFLKNQLVYHIKMENKEMKFICTELKKDTLVFINNANDFPKRIVYVRPESESMSVWIENFPNDPNQMNFPFKKIR